MNELELLIDFCAIKKQDAKELAKRLVNAPEGLKGGYRGEIRAYNSIISQIETYKCSELNTSGEKND